MNNVQSLISKFLELVIYPHKDIQKLDEQRNAGLLSGLLFAIVVLGVISATSQLIFVPDFMETFVGIMVGVSIMATAYLISRTKYYQAGVLIALLVPPFVIYNNLNVNPEDKIAVSFFLIGIFFSHMFLNHRWFAISVVFYIAMMFLIPFYLLDFSLSDLIGEISVVLFVTILLIISKIHRDLLEDDRRLEIKLAESRFQSLFEQSPLSSIRYTPDGKVLGGNQASIDLWNIPEDTRGLIYQQYNILEDPQLEALGVLSDIKRGFQGEYVQTKPIAYDPSVTDPEYIGPIRWLRSFIYPINDNHGNIQEVVVIHEDITERVEFEEALKESEEQYRTLVNNVKFGIYRTSFSPEENIIQANPAIAEIFGYQSIDELLSCSPDSFYANPKDRDLILSEIKSRGFVKNKEIKLVREDGTTFWARINTTANYGADGQIRWLDGILEDITEKKRIEEKLQHDAFHDPLTNLPNRALFMDRLEHALGRANRKTGYLYAVIFCDLDRFKNINDSLGHEIGDLVLIQIGQLLCDCVRKVDTVARFSGDEYIVLLEEIHSIQDAIEITSRMQEKLSEPLDIQNHKVQVSGSFGIALHAEGYRDPGELIRDADVAMYRAKATGKNRYEIFDNSMLDQVIERIRTETDLRKAIEEDQIKVYFQPILNLSTLSLVGFESLVRWDHPKRGITAPGTFLPIAEETGLIIDLGKIVIRDVANKLSDWIEEYPLAEDLTVNINLSVKQLLDPMIFQEINKIFVETNLEPKNIKIEVTEDSIMDDVELSLAMINQYQSLEVEIQLDDFGTGFSSLAALNQFPFSGIKIDQSFTENLLEREENKDFVETIITLGKTLKMDVIAEGIETQEQLDGLIQLGCKFGQGYFLSHPVASQEAKIFLIEKLKEKHIE